MSQNNLEESEINTEIPMEIVGQSDIASTSSNSHILMSTATADDNFKVVCMECLRSTDINASEFVHMREDLKSFLKRSRQGRCILMYYETHKKLSDRLQVELVRLIIDRELGIIFYKNNVSLQNPLKMFSIGSDILENIAKEIQDLFNEDSGTFYSPARTHEKVKVRACGKLLHRINYVRVTLIEDGFLAFEKKINVDISTEQTQFSILRDFNESWDNIKIAWENSVEIRQNYSKIRKSGWWQIEEFPCLQNTRGLDLILQDFNTNLAYDTVPTDIVATWNNLHQHVTSFIKSKSLKGEDEILVAENLSELPELSRDPSIFYLLPQSIKAAKSRSYQKVTKTPRSKKQKVESEEEKSRRRIEPETFFVVVNNHEEFKSHLEAKQNSTPYVAVIGALAEPNAVFTVYNNVCHEATSVIEAFLLAVKIYLALYIAYPAATNHARVFVQRLILKVVTGTDKLLTAVHQALSFVRQSVEAINA